MKNIHIVVLFLTAGMLIFISGSAQVQTPLVHSVDSSVTSSPVQFIGNSHQLSQLCCGTDNLSNLRKESKIGRSFMPNIEEVRRIKAEVEPELMNHPKVVGLDIGRQRVNGKKTDTLAIRIYVSHREDISEENPLPTEIQGVPVEVIERRFTPHS